VSLDYLMVPGFNDQVQEFDYLCKFLEETQVNMVQWRNLSIDPDHYIKAVGFIDKGTKVASLRERMGMKKFMEKIEATFPHMRFGHFNPSLDPTASKYSFEEN